MILKCTTKQGNRKIWETPAVFKVSRWSQLTFKYSKRFDISTIIRQHESINELDVCKFVELTNSLVRRSYRSARRSTSGFQ